MNYREGSDGAGSAACIAGALAFITQSVAAGVKKSINSTIQRGEKQRLNLAEI